MSDNRVLFTEEAIIGAVKRLLTGRVNELLGELQFNIPLIEFGIFRGDNVIAPSIQLTSCEQTDKERIIKLNTYSLTITIPVLEDIESEILCFAYANSIKKALGEDTTLGGIANRTVMAGKKYVPPKKPDCGMEWELIIYLRVTIEE